MSSYLRMSLFSAMYPWVNSQMEKWVLSLPYAGLLSHGLFTSSRGYDMIGQTIIWMEAAARRNENGEPHRTDRGKYITGGAQCHIILHEKHTTNYNSG